jgi:hypothetical protein
MLRAWPFLLPVRLLCEVSPLLPMLCEDRSLLKPLIPHDGMTDRASAG